MITLDTTEFDRAAKQLLEETSRTMPDFCNGHMLAVAKGAIRLTKKANRNEIERQMGVTSKVETLRSGKEGQRGWVRIKKRVLDETNSFAARIINADRKKRGLPLVWGEQLKALALDLIQRKVKSVAFVRTGWFPALAQLAARVYKKPSFFQQKKTGKAIKGYAVPAEFTLTGVVSCTIANVLEPGQRTTWHGRPGSPLEVATQGLQKALNAETASMQKHFEEKFSPVFKKYSAK